MESLKHLGVFSVLLLLILVSNTSFGSPSVSFSESSFSLPSEIKMKLTFHLQRLSQGWFQESVDFCNKILSNTSYTSEVWDNFFSEYFNTNPFTDDLRNYIIYPTFFWFSDEVHLNLQRGLIGPITRNIKNIMESYTDDDLSDVLINNPEILQTLMNSHRFLNDIAKWGIVSDDEKREIIFTFYIDLVKSFPLLLKKEVTFDSDKQPYLATLRAQVWMNLRDMVTLTPNVKDEIAKTIGLGGRYLEIWDSFSVLVIDNNGFDDKQLKIIFTVLNSIPTSLHNLGSITCNDLLGNTGERYLWFDTRMTINVFNIKVSIVKENPFPDDVSPIYSDVFTSVLIHEINHGIDHFYITRNTNLNSRKLSLIASAGNQSMNYLRSMFPDGFFVQYPQEFFASISNQYFTNSSHTLMLALTRFNKDYRDPINQFLFFADIYSLGKNYTFFYTLYPEGNIKRETVAIMRDANGYLNSLILKGYIYRFILDYDGSVLSYSIENLENAYILLLKDYEALKVKYDSLQQELKVVQSNLADLRQLTTALQNKYSNLNKTFTSLKNNYEFLRTNYTSLEDNYKKLQQDYALTKEENSKLKASLSQAQTLQYVFVITTIVLLASTMFLAAKRKVKTK